MVTNRPDPGRSLATVLFTDIVNSTKLAAALGDREWGKLLEGHHTLVRSELARHGGREVRMTGDGFFAIFDAPAEAVHCARAIIASVAGLGVEVRTGLHTGECEISGVEVKGIAVHIAARISALAGPGEVLVSSTVKELVSGSGIRFTDRGSRALKGVPGRWYVFAAELDPEQPPPEASERTPDRRVRSNPTRGNGRAPATRSAETISLMLVDDHPMWREILREVLEQSGVAEVVAEASDGAEAVALAKDVRPDLVLMDIELPTMSGVEATRALVADRADIKVLVLSSSNQRSQVVEAIEAGASGYLLKTAKPDEVADAVRRIYSGELAFPSELADVVLSEFRQRSGRRGDPEGSRPQLIEGDVFRREGDYWTVAHQGEVFRLRDAKGVRYLSWLLRHPGQEVHAMDLVAAERGGQAPRGAQDAGDVLDPKAKAAYKRKLQELSEDLEEAESWADAERASRAREEIDALTEELARGVGLGGRNRKAASSAERARVNVTLAIKATLGKIDKHAPTLGRHLAATINTGNFCSYTPDPRLSISWTS